MLICLMNTRGNLQGAHFVPVDQRNLLIWRSSLRRFWSAMVFIPLDSVQAHNGMLDRAVHRDRVLSSVMAAGGFVNSSNGFSGMRSECVHSEAQTPALRPECRPNPANTLCLCPFYNAERRLIALYIFFSHVILKTSTGLLSSLR